MKVFLDNREKVLSHNARFANGEVTFELGMNMITGTETVFMAPENFVAPT